MKKKNTNGKELNLEAMLWHPQVSTFGEEA